MYRSLHLLQKKKLYCCVKSYVEPHGFAMSRTRIRSCCLSATILEFRSHKMLLGRKTNCKINPVWHVLSLSGAAFYLFEFQGCLAHTYINENVLQELRLKISSEWHIRFILGCLFKLDI